MRHSGAPEVRGSKQAARFGLDHRIGLPVLLMLALALTTCSFRNVEALAAAGASEAPQRRLLAAAPLVRPYFSLPEHEVERR